MAGRSPSQNQVKLLLLLPFFLWLFAFLLLPAIMMLISSFHNEGGQGFTLGQYVKGLTHPLYTTAIKNSVMLSLVSALVGIVVAAFAAYSFTTFPPKSRDRMLSVSNMMTNFAGVPLAFGFIVLFGTNGMLTLLFKQLGLSFLVFDLYSWKGLAWVYIYFQIPVGILLIYPSLYALKQEWRESASLLGAGTVQYWLRIGVPVLLPGLVGTFSVLFANAMGAYATAYALVTSNFNLLPIQIGGLVSGDVFPRVELGSALAIILFLILALALFINEKMLRLARRGLNDGR
ncbi:ABC transporter permease [Cohnella candidum]|uniref:ABC transporter permease n=1 Tax=Cohnella candidum TaxID=2674991 RepID=A0A3G3K3R2_9BACL|nr:ABC transporter permease [Cohnella candidum]AYQ74677.1 ABC transporter permease [Cohnella candidum]